MKKVLMLASVASMIDQFNMPNIQVLQELGYEVHVACNFEKGNTCSENKILELKKKLNQISVSCFQINFSRNVTSICENIKAYKRVLNLLKENKYDFIHCHSPIGGVCGRLAAKKTKTKVVYTAHGFHFYKGAPILNWIFFYPVEKILSKYTDTIITINMEDYKRAQRFKAKHVEKINGVGFDIAEVSNSSVNKEEMKNKLGIPKDGFVVLSVGELNKNKNHEVIIRAIAHLDETNIYYVICGQGSLYEHLRELAKKLGIFDRVKLLGFRNDVFDIYKASDVFAFPSKREGLGLSALEAMANGLPVITSDVHGINDYSDYNVTGYKCNSCDCKKFAESIKKLYDHPDDRIRMGKVNQEKVMKYDIVNVSPVMRKIYSRIAR